VKKLLFSDTHWWWGTEGAAVYENEYALDGRNRARGISRKPDQGPKLGVVAKVYEHCVVIAEVEDAAAGRFAKAYERHVSIYEGEDVHDNGRLE
jgi:hypothetical protein